MSPRDDLNMLLNHALETAGEFITRDGQFGAFGAGMTPGGEVAVVTVQPPEDDSGTQLDPAVAAETIQEALRSDAQGGAYRAVYACTDGAVTGDDGKQVDAIVVRMEHQEHEPVLIALPYWVNDGQWSFGEPGRAPYGEPIFFGHN